VEARQLVIEGRLNLPGVFVFRYTSTSLKLNHGIPLIVISRKLGHAKPSIPSDIYEHLIPGMHVEAAEMIDELVTPVKLHLLHPKRIPESKQNHNTPTCRPKKEKTPIYGG
jgi:hypothetical protein